MLNWLNDAELAFSRFNIVKLELSSKSTYFHCISTKENTLNYVASAFHLSELRFSHAHSKNRAKHCCTWKWKFGHCFTVRECRKWEYENKCFNNLDGSEWKHRSMKKQQPQLYFLQSFCFLFPWTIAYIYIWE